MAGEVPVISKAPGAPSPDLNASADAVQAAPASKLTDATLPHPTETAAGWQNPPETASVLGPGPPAPVASSGKALPAAAAAGRVQEPPLPPPRQDTAPVDVNAKLTNKTAPLANAAAEAARRADETNRDWVRCVAACLIVLLIVTLVVIIYFIRSSEKNDSDGRNRRPYGVKQLTVPAEVDDRARATSQGVERETTWSVRESGGGANDASGAFSESRRPYGNASEAEPSMSGGDELPTERVETKPDATMDV
ncbi:hypothetical protein V5799_021077 [Amblyomma americanum]|uniref:Transmembrane protein n=1 Tax=Amblyomma americanum TaxID=6943 RepID=A0AAQ4FP58_AMBAM